MMKDILVTSLLSLPTLSMVYLVYRASKETSYSYSESEKKRIFNKIGGDKK